MKRRSIALLALAIALCGIGLGYDSAGSQALTVAEAPQPVNDTLVRWSSPREEIASTSGTCGAPTPLACGQTVHGDNSGQASSISAYDCMPSWNESGPELIYAVELLGTTPYTVTATLTNLAADLDVFLLSPAGCSGGECLTDDSYGDNAASASGLTQGSYLVSVDGFNGATSPYSLTLTCDSSSSGGTCVDPLPVSCGSYVTGHTADFSNNIGTYSCSAWNESGPEAIYSFTLPAGSNYDVSAAISEMAADLDVFLVDPAACASGQCLQDNSSGDQIAEATNVPPGTYDVVVDGYNGVSSPFRLDVTCTPLAAGGTCTSPLPISCGDHVTGDTTGGASLHNGYSCNAWDETGPEHVYAFTLPAGSHRVTAALSELGGTDLDLFLLDPAACEAGQCLDAGSFGNITATATIDQPGTYYLSVDGFSGAAGSYALDLTCTPISGPGELVVNTNLDDEWTHDINPGDGLCEDGRVQCSLRAAMEEANAHAGADSITFDETFFSSPLTITIDSLQGALPPLTDTVTISASSVWDTGQDRPGVTIEAGGIDFEGLVIAADSCEVYGLHITDFGENAIRVQSAGNTIGGPGAGQRNVLSGSGKNGLWLVMTGAHNNIVQNNYIGLNPAGNAALANLDGIFISHGATGNTIGGGIATEGNVISGNMESGISISGDGTDGNRLGGNIIGLAADGATPLGNGQGGVFVAYGLNTDIGTGPALAGNTIAGNAWEGVYISYGANGTSLEGNTINDNGWAGVLITGTSGCHIAANTIASNALDGVGIGGSSSAGNTITTNSIYDNGWAGINLIHGSNASLAAPTITNATPVGASGTACSSCRVEVFSDAADEGKTYHGFTTADGSGNWTYNGALSGPNITATSTDAAGNTSEFSTPFSWGAKEYIVNTNLDDALSHDTITGNGQCLDGRGLCSLRAAIEEANARLGGDTVTFDETVFSTPLTITVDGLEGAFPDVTEPLTLTASNIWNAGQNRPGVAIDGNGGDIHGLYLLADSCQIYGLALYRFGQAAIHVGSAHNQIGGTGSGHRNVLGGSRNGIWLAGSGAHHNVVRNNYVGVSAKGDTAIPNTTGIVITGGAHDNTIGGSTSAEGNVISGNTENGVLLSDSNSDSNALGGNRIGVAADKNSPLGNGMAGVLVMDGAAANKIGGSPALDANLILYNGSAGVSIAGGSDGNEVRQNAIQWNGNSGVIIVSSSDSRIFYNTIAQNGAAGVWISGSAAAGNTLSLNSIYDNGLAGIDLDGGANMGIVAPIITSANQAGASGTACPWCIVEIFTDDEDEGENGHGWASADGSGNWSFSGSLIGLNVTATQTDAGGNTSEFSAPYNTALRIFLPLVLRSY